MPKETIHGRDGEMQIVVGWQRGTDVQLGVVNTNSRAPVNIAYDVAGEQVVAQQNIATTYAESNGWFTDLDRKCINDLIRLLRRARDAAFGRDE